MEQVYEAIGRPFILPALDGLNGTIFAYGVTSSGKTHTMMGTPHEPGIVPRIINDTFAQAAAVSRSCSGGSSTGGGSSSTEGCSPPSCGSLRPSRSFTFRMSMMEIYNEVLNDLLEPANLNLKLREGAGKGVVVDGLMEEVVWNAEQALELVERGDAYRKVRSAVYADQTL